MNVRTQWGWVGLKVVLSLLVLGVALGLTYEPGPAPVVGEIQHYTYLPPNTSRTEIGIGEPIRLYIAQFQDEDVRIDDEGNKSPVNDVIGEVVWNACPGRGKFDPPVGAWTTFTAGLADFDDSEEVYAEIWDSRKMGLDPSDGKRISLRVRVPSGNVPYWYGPDQKLGTDGPPDNSMGVGTWFVFQMQPNTVNFSNMMMKETRDRQTFPWPNKNTSEYLADEWDGPASEPGTIFVPGVGSLHNSAWDWVITGGPWKVDRLFNGKMDEDATFPVKQKLWYRNSQTPVTFKMYQETTHPRWFYKFDTSSKVGWQGNSNAETKEARGPYKETGL